MKKKFVFGILCFMLLCLCACVTRNEEELWDVDAYPCIIFNRGGNREFGANEPENIAYLAETSGKVIFATQYRGVDGGTGTEEYRISLRINFSKM